MLLNRPIRVSSRCFHLLWWLEVHPILSAGEKGMPSHRLLTNSSGVGGLEAGVQRRRQQRLVLQSVRIVEGRVAARLPPVVVESLRGVNVLRVGHYGCNTCKGRIRPSLSSPGLVADEGVRRLAAGKTRKAGNPALASLVRLGGN